MFKILYHPTTGEQLDLAQLTAAGFDGVESDGQLDSGIPAVGIRCSDLSFAITALKTEKYAYATFQPKGDWVELITQIKQQMHGIAGLLAVEPWNMRRTVRELWQFAETIENKNVRLAISSEWGKTFEQVGARAVPTLNHRIGVVRVNADENEIAMDYARRLAGIGYAGFLVICGQNSAGLEEAQKLVQSIRQLLEPPAAKPKAAVKKPVHT